MRIHVSIQHWLTEEGKGRLEAHTAKEESLQQDEMLEEHSDLVMHHAEILMRDNGVEAAVHRALDRLGIDREQLDESVRQMIMCTILDKPFICIFIYGRCRNGMIQQSCIQIAGSINAKCLHSCIIFYIHSRLRSLATTRTWLI